MSFRLRLLLTSLTTLAVGLGALLVLGNVLLDRQVGTQAAQVLHERAQTEIAALQVTRTGVRVREVANDAALDQQAWVFQDGQVIEQPTNASTRTDAIAWRLSRRALPAEAHALNDVRLRAERVAASGPAARAVVVVGLSTSGLERLQKIVALGSAVLALLVLVAGAVAIFRAVDGALAPVALMTEQARSWGAEDLDRRFSLGAPTDELTGLATTLDGLLARIAGARRREQRLAAEVAHELRTPLAGIRGRAELALDDPGDPQETRAAFAAIVHQAERLSGSIDALLAAARRDLDPTADAVDLRAVLADLDASLPIAAPADLPLVEGDAEIVRQALAPLLENARRHARTGVRAELAILGDDVRVVIADDGDGLRPGDPERHFAPGVSTSGGAGLGLPLARRLARSCGGDVTAELDVRGGRFVLTLPAAFRRSQGASEQSAAHGRHRDRDPTVDVGEGAQQGP